MQNLRRSFRLCVCLFSCFAWVLPASAQDLTRIAVASTLNAKDGAITSNMALVPTTNQDIDAYANSLTHLILDVSSFFAP